MGEREPTWRDSSHDGFVGALLPAIALAGDSARLNFDRVAPPQRRVAVVQTQLASGDEVVDIVPEQNNSSLGHTVTIAARIAKKGGELGEGDAFRKR